MPFAAHAHLQMALGRVCTSVALVSLVMLPPTLVTGYGGPHSAALTGLAQPEVRRCCRTCEGAVGAPQGNACAAPRVAPTSAVTTQGPLSWCTGTRTFADAIGDDAAANAPSAPLPITAADHQWALEGESLGTTLGPEPARLLRGRHRRRRDGHAQRGQEKGFGEPNAAEEGLGLTAAWSWMTVISGVGLLVAGRHYSWLVCLALSLNFWCAAACIASDTSPRVGLTLLAFAVVQRQSVWLFGKQGSCVLASYPAPDFLLGFASRRRVCTRASTVALSWLTPSPPNHVCRETQEGVTRTWTPIATEGWAHKRYNRGVWRMVSPT